MGEAWAALLRGCFMKSMSLERACRQTQCKSESATHTAIGSLSFGMSLIHKLPVNEDLTRSGTAEVVALCAHPKERIGFEFKFVRIFDCQSVFKSRNTVALHHAAH
ncbi:hypothetical protein FRIGORI9N_420026 [Frigoribacterium sp. 9N]|nr:hypothetical protein FRIGORI9N_420026 [Frigoribacterium sp. 9N]